MDTLATDIVYERYSTCVCHHKHYCIIKAFIVVVCNGYRVCHIAMSFLLLKMYVQIPKNGNRVEMLLNV